MIDWLTEEFPYYLRQEITCQQKEDTNWMMKIYTVNLVKILACIDIYETNFVVELSWQSCYNCIATSAEATRLGASSEDHWTRRTQR